MRTKTWFLKAGLGTPFFSVLCRAVRYILSFFLFQLFIGFHINKKLTVLYSITLLQYDTVLFVDIPASLVAGPTHLEAQSMAPNQTFPADDGAGVAGQVP